MLKITKENVNSRFVPKIKGSLKTLVMKLKNSQEYYFFLIWRPILWCVTPIQNNITCNLSYSDSRKDFPGGSEGKSVCLQWGRNHLCNCTKNQFSSGLPSLSLQKYWKLRVINTLTVIPDCRGKSKQPHYPAGTRVTLSIQSTLNLLHSCIIEQDSIYI